MGFIYISIPRKSFRIKIFIKIKLFLKKQMALYFEEKKKHL